MSIKADSFSIKDFEEDFELETNSNGKILPTPLNRKKNIMFMVENMKTVVKQIAENYKKYDNNVKRIKLLTGQKGMIINIFDAHFGSIVIRDDYITDNPSIVTYNFDIAKKRMDAYFETAIEELSTGQYDHAVINIGGDNVDGNGAVYPTQHYHIEADAYTQIDRFAESIFWNIYKIKKLFPDIHLEVVGIPGNHGVDKGNITLASIQYNLDTLSLDKIDSLLKLSVILNEAEYKIIKDVRVKKPKNDSGINGFEMKGWKYMSIHELRKNLSTSTTKNQAMNFGELTGARVIFTGHFHDSAYETAGDVRMIRVGCMPGPNNYSDKLGIMSAGAEQTIVTVTKDNPTETIRIVPFFGAGNGRR